MCASRLIRLLPQAHPFGAWSMSLGPTGSIPLRDRIDIRAAIDLRLML
jgi:hypothetical protein